jgi:ABC-2 type transport system ATP-binding protein
MAAIETRALNRRFGRTEAVNGLTLDVPDGSIFALLGPNGAGKTTTIKLLMNLLRPTSGTACVLGRDARRLGPEHMQRIGYVSESQRLPDWMTIADLAAYCRPLYRRWDDELAASLQASLNLGSASRIGTFSRGMRMKVALLAALAYRPDLIVLDEPFSGLDPVVRDELTRTLLASCTEHAATVFVSSHDVDEVERLADHIGFINDGRLSFSETTASLLARFRLVEVIADPLPRLPPDPRWLVQGAAGRTLRFVDTAHDAPDAAARITAAFPGADVRISPLSLREIFVAHATATTGSHA